MVVAKNNDHFFFSLGLCHVFCGCFPLHMNPSFLSSIYDLICFACLFVHISRLSCFDMSTLPSASGFFIHYHCFCL